MKDKRLMMLVALTVLIGCKDKDKELVTASGTIEATEADLGFQTGGRVADVVVNEGDIVQQGQILARLDVEELNARKQAAQAQLSAARALLAELQRGARPQEKGQAQSGVSAARRRMEETQASLARTRKLYEGGAVSKEQLDQAETAYTVAKAQADQATEQLSLVNVGPRQERIEAQRAQVQQAEAAVAQVDAMLDNAIIKAPFAGVVTVKHREPGESVSPGLPVVTLMNPSDRWVRIFVREDEIGRTHLNQSAQITSDSHPDKTYRGRVTFIASQAEFTPRNVQTAEERVKLVYAVKVAIVGDSALELKTGVPADVRLDK